MSPQRRRS